MIRFSGVVLSIIEEIPLFREVEMLKRYHAAVLVLLAFLAAFGPASQSAAADAQRITKDALKAMLDDPGVLVIDVRTEKEWKKADSKIKGAVWEDADEIKTWAGKYPRDKSIALYCS
jgi:3-mercaptopyruvate sulfurtransferase SseA